MTTPKTFEDVIKTLRYWRNDYHGGTVETALSQMRSLVEGLKTRCSCGGDFAYHKSTFEQYQPSEYSCLKCKRIIQERDMIQRNQALDDVLKLMK